MSRYGRPSREEEKQSWKNLHEELLSLDENYFLHDSTYTNEIYYQRMGFINITESYRSKSFFLIQFGSSREQQRRCDYFSTKSIKEIAQKIHKKVIELSLLSDRIKSQKAAAEQLNATTIKNSLESLNSTGCATIDKVYNEKGSQSQLHKVCLGMKLTCTTSDGTYFHNPVLNISCDAEQLKELYQFSLMKSTSAFDELILANVSFSLLSNSPFIRQRAEKLVKEKAINE